MSILKKPVVLLIVVEGMLNRYLGVFAAYLVGGNSGDLADDSGARPQISKCSPSLPSIQASGNSNGARLAEVFTAALL